MPSICCGSASVSDADDLVVGRPVGCAVLCCRRLSDWRYAEILAAYLRWAACFETPSIAPTTTDLPAAHHESRPVALY